MNPTTTSSCNTYPVNFDLSINTNNANPTGSTDSYKRIHPKNNSELIVNNKNMNDECSICLNEMNLADREITLTNCNHLFHKRCFDEWIEKHENIVISCPICRHPVTTNTPYWNESLKSFVFKVSKSELNRPEPVISQAVRFKEISPQSFVVDVALAFKGIPAVAVRSENTKITIPENIYPLRVITDNDIMTINLPLNPLRENVEHTPSTLISMFMGLCVSMTNITSQFKNKIQSCCNSIVGYPKNPALSEFISIAIEAHENNISDQYCVFTPGIPFKSITTLGNAISFIGYLATMGRSKPWFFDQPKEFLKYGDKVVAMNLPLRNMSWLPIITKTNQLTPESSEAATSSSVIEEQTTGPSSVNDLTQDWRDWLKLGIRVSCNSDASNPFAEYRGLTFMNKSTRSACILNSHIADQIVKPDIEYDKYKKNFLEGIKKLDDNDSFFVIIDAAIASNSR